MLAIFALSANLLTASIEQLCSRTDQIQCQSYLRQLWDCSSLYSEENGHRLPHKDNGSTQPPYGSAWSEVLGIAPFEMGFDRVDIGYNLKMNSRLEDFRGTKSQASEDFLYLPGVENPSLSPYLFDGRIDDWYQSKMYGGPSSVDPKHKLEANFLFLDGSSQPIFEIPSPEGGWSGHGNLLWDPYVELDKQRF